jgi:hypothetical protein
MQDDVFAHAVGEVRIDHAHDRRLRQAVVAHQVVDPGAERKDGREVRQAGEAARRMLPRDGVMHVAPIEWLAKGDDLAVR